MVAGLFVAAHQLPLGMPVLPGALGFHLDDERQRLSESVPHLSAMVAAAVG